MLERLLSPFIGYWYWAQDRETPLSKGLALGAPLVVFGVVLYLLFGRGGDDGTSFLPNATTTQDIASGTQTPAATPGPTQPASTGAAPAATGSAPATGSPAAPSGTAAPAPTAFTQERYTVVSGDTPGGIAEKVGVPEENRAAWIEEMLALNGVTATGLQIGQELILPPF